MNEAEKRRIIRETPLEEIIKIKLEEASKMMNDKFFGFKLWEAMFYIVGSSILNYVEQFDDIKACRILGITRGEYHLIKGVFKK